MTKALIIYGSTTGNTEYTAEQIQKEMEAQSWEVTLLNVTDAEVSELEKPFDLYLLGASTWGTDEIEIQEDFEGFYEGMGGGLSLGGKPFAVFGCGDSDYEYFCGAVDVIEERVDRLGARVVGESLRIDGEPEDQEIQEWIQGILNKL